MWQSTFLLSCFLVLQTAAGQAVVAIGPDGSTCPAVVTFTVQPLLYSTYITGATTLTNFDGHGNNITFTASTTFVTTLYSSEAALTATSRPVTVSTLPDGSLTTVTQTPATLSSRTPSSTTGGSSTTISLRSSASSGVAGSVTLPNTITRSTVTQNSGIFTPVPPPTTTRSPILYTVTTTDANGDDVVSTISQPALPIGTGLPPGRVTDSDPDTPILLGYVYGDISPNGAKHRRQAVEPVVGFLQGEGTSASTGPSCGNAVRFTLQDGQLINQDLENIGKNIDDTYALIGPSPDFLDVITQFYFDNGILSWNATDGEGPATFYRCSGPVYAGFPDPPLSNCSVVTLGGVSSSACPVDNTVDGGNPVDPPGSPSTSGTSAPVSTSGSSSLSGASTSLSLPSDSVVSTSLVSTTATTSKSTATSTDTLGTSRTSTPETITATSSPALSSASGVVSSAGTTTALPDTFVVTNSAVTTYIPAATATASLAYCPTYDNKVVADTYRGNFLYQIYCDADIGGTDIGYPSGYTTAYVTEMSKCLDICNVWNAQRNGYCQAVVYLGPGSCYAKTNVYRQDGTNGRGYQYNYDYQGHVAAQLLDQSYQLPTNTKAQSSGYSAASSSSTSSASTSVTSSSSSSSSKTSGSASSTTVSSSAGSSTTAASVSTSSTSTSSISGSAVSSSSLSSSGGSTTGASSSSTGSSTATTSTTSSSSSTAGTSTTTSTSATTLTSTSTSTTSRTSTPSTTTPTTTTTTSSTTSATTTTTSSGTTATTTSAATSSSTTASTSTSSATTTISATPTNTSIPPGYAATNTAVVTYQARATAPISPDSAYCSNYDGAVIADTYRGTFEYQVFCDQEIGGSDILGTPPGPIITSTGMNRCIDICNAWNAAYDGYCEAVIKFNSDCYPKYNIYPQANDRGQGTQYNYYFASRTVAQLLNSLYPAPTNTKKTS